MYTTRAFVNPKDVLRMVSAPSAGMFKYQYQEHPQPQVLPGPSAIGVSDSNNISVVDNDVTARTRHECAEQRATNLKILGVETVLELCVGPSLRTLEDVYSRVDISVTGNDIASRWQECYPSGKWLIGDALLLDITEFDAVVFAPPLSRGCTGKREDALMIDEVFPRYQDFYAKHKNTYKGVIVLVLPARAFATGYDREKTFELLARLLPHEIVPLRAERRQIVKYYDVYVNLEPVRLPKPKVMTDI